MLTQARSLALWAIAIALGSLTANAASGIETIEGAATAGRSYYVAQLHPHANDQNPGTEDAPFRSINGALTALADKLQPGDTLWIKNGTYREAIWLRGPDEKGDGVRIPSGTGYATMISLSAYPGHQPVIKGSDLVTGWVRDRDAIWVHENWTFNSQQVFADGRPLDQIGGQLSPGYVERSWHGRYRDRTRDQMVPGSFYVDTEAKRLYVWLPNGGDPNQAVIEADARLYLLRVGDLDYIRLSGLTLRHGSNAGTEFAFGVTGRFCIAERIDQAWHGFGGGYLGGEYNTFTHCRFNHNGNSGMGGTGRGHRLLFTETSYNNYRNWGSGWHAGGVKFIPGCHDWIVRGHVSSYNNADGIWFDEWMSGITIEECFSFRNRGSGIHYEIGSRGIIKNNVIYENGMRGIYLSSGAYCLVANNVLYRNGMSGICSILGTRKDHSIYTRGKRDVIPGGNNVVIGNILVDNCSIPYLLNELKNWELPDYIKDYYTNFLTEWVAWTNRPELIMPETPDGPDGSWSDYNIFYRTGGRGDPEKLPFGRNWDVGFAAGLKDWREKTGWDEHSIFAQPKFVNEAQRDFRPADDSPALWFVKKVDMGVRYGMEGRQRPGYHIPVTAGPYGGREDQFAQAQQSAETQGTFLFPLPAVGAANVYRFAMAPSVMLDSLEQVYVTPIQRGVRVMGTPYLMDRGALFLSSKRKPAVLNEKFSLGATIDTLCLLVAGAPKQQQPFAKITLHREDGVDIDLEISGTPGEVLSCTSRGKPVPIQLAWKGETRYWDTEERREQVQVYQLTWTNDNPWLPVNRMKATLLDPEAEFVIMGITGSRNTNP